MQKNLKRGKLIVGMIAFLLLNAGCKNTSVNNLCLWANPITITQSELNLLSEETLRQIDNFNQEFEERCGQKIRIYLRKIALIDLIDKPYEANIYIALQGFLIKNINQISL